MVAVQRNLVVCSDGTGNSGRGAVGTNVWRVRQAVQAYNGEEGAVDQQIIYQDGVGTHAFMPLKVLGLMFSYGVTKDLEYLYERLMLQYEECDRLFLFGFSRGAFTIRTLAYMLYLCGLASPFDDQGQRRSVAEIREIAKQAVIAYKMRHLGYHVNFRKKYGRTFDTPQQPAWGKGSGRNALPIEETKGRVRIDYIGVWDTVSAVGLPFHNFTQFFLQFWRGVTAFWLFRWAKLSLLNMRRPTDKFWTEWEDDLHPYIANAYHALALDDERDTFYPVLWLEKQPCKCGGLSPCRCQEISATRMTSVLRREKTELVKVRSKRVRTTAGTDPGEQPLNVEQVWFAGMHADVGGGYDQDHLAHVSLAWMMAHAARCGLAFAPELVTHYRQNADPIGRMHDSREGLAIFYRYNPRNVEWLSADVGISADAGDRPLIHDSVFERIEGSSQSYVPKHIPFAERYDVVKTPPEPSCTPVVAGGISSESPRLEWDPMNPPNFLVPERLWQLRAAAKPPAEPATSHGSDERTFGTLVAAALKVVAKLLSVVGYGPLYLANLVFVGIARLSGHSHPVTPPATDPRRYADARRYADETIHIYIILRRAAARWVLYVVLLAAMVAMFGGLKELSNSIIGRDWLIDDAIVFNELGELHRGWYRHLSWMWPFVPLLQITVLLLTGTLVSLVVAAAWGSRRLRRYDLAAAPLQPASRIGPWWPVISPFVVAAMIFVVGFVLRPLAHSLLNALAPRPVSEMLAPIMQSGIAFGLLCLAVHTVLWFNRHYTRRIESWATYAWDSTRFGVAQEPPAFLVWPRSVVESLFSERKFGVGRYIGRIATLTFFPILSMGLLTIVFIGVVVWIPLEDLLTRASVQTVADGELELQNGSRRSAGSPVASIANELPLEGVKWKSDRMLNVNVELIKGRQYVVTVKGAVLDGDVPGAISGIDLSKTNNVVLNDAKFWMRRMESMKRLPSKGYFQLCGIIGGPAAPEMFPISSGVPFTATANGTLYLFLNDVPGFSVNNLGDLTVGIQTILRAAE